jgi:SHS2 domain-containing protein
MAFSYLEELSRADIAFRATGTDPTELFRSCWQAVLELMIRDPASLRRRETRTVEIREDDGELLLYGFLEALLYYRDAEGILLRIDTLSVCPEPWMLEARLVGEAPDPERHVLGTEVKAVTWHRFSVTHQPSGWEAVVVVDV